MNNERMLIGQILLDNKIYHSLKITEEDFQEVKPRRIFRAIKKCIDAGITADILTVYDQDQKIDSSFLAGITSNTPTTANWEYYHKAILSKSYAVKVRRVAMQFREWVEELDAEESLERLEKELLQLSQTKSGNKITKLKEIVPDFINLIEARYKGQGELPGIPSGIMGLDKLMLGFRKRMLYLIGGRPSQGKSALLLNMACNAGINLGHKVGYISTESSVLEIITRLFSSEGHIDSMHLIAGNLAVKDFSKLTDIAGRVYEKDMFFYYTPGMTLSEVGQTARLMVKHYGCEIIFVDYLQDISVIGRETTIEKTAKKSKVLKYLAEELDVPVVAGAQLRRDSDERRPRLSDFSDSSQLEKDADGGVLIYHQNTTKKDEEPVYSSYLLVEKMRDGKTGAVPVYFNKEYVKFEARVG